MLTGTYRVPGATDVLVEDGVTGVLTPPADEDALAAALEPLLRDPVRRAALGRQARAMDAEPVARMAADDRACYHALAAGSAG